MGTATILGDTYDTVVMPDGKEWLKTNLRRADCGTIYPGDGSAETLAYGRNYIGSEVLGWSDFPDGWHVPSKAEWDGLFMAIGCSYGLGPGGKYWTSAGNKLKKAGTAHWSAAGGIDPYGFGITGSGTSASWRRDNSWLATSTPIDPIGINVYGFISNAYNPQDIADGAQEKLPVVPSAWLDYNLAVRLVRDPNTLTPVISPASGTYVDPLEVTITCETEGSVILYTTDGSEPDENSPIYTGPIDFRSLTGTGTVKAIAFSPTLPPSSVATANYTFKLKVFIQPESGGYSDYIKCSIRTNHIVPETVVYYTTDGSTPTEASLVYSEPFTITPPYSGEFVVKAFAVNASFVTSDIETESYYYKAPSPIDKASLTLETGLEGFNPITGKFNRLGCSGAVLLGGNLAWELTDTEYELFAGWIAFCGGEESRLTIPMITGDVELPHVIQLLELLSVGRDTGAYSLSANAKIVTRPFPDGFSWQGWAGALYGPPATYPTELPSPQWGFSTAPQALFVATGGVSTAARLRQARGSVLKASWKLSGAQFDYWLAWFCWSLAFGRRKFVFDQAGVGPWRCQFVEDLKLNIDGVNFTVTATLFYVETGT